VVLVGGVAASFEHATASRQPASTTTLSEVNREVMD
jgi:hypothetical protein